MPSIILPSPTPRQEARVLFFSPLSWSFKKKAVKKKRNLNLFNNLSEHTRVYDIIHNQMAQIF